MRLQAAHLSEGQRRCFIAQYDIVAYDARRLSGGRQKEARAALEALKEALWFIGLEVVPIDPTNTDMQKPSLALWKIQDIADWTEV